MTVRQVLSGAAIVLGVLLAGCQQTGSAGAREIQIKRDTFGTAHVYADSVYGLFQGYGYVVAQDRLFQLEMARRTSQGTVAQVLGADYLAFDRRIRSNYSPQAIAAQVAALDTQERAILDGYAEGINRWLAVVEGAPEQWLPQAFQVHGFMPTQWGAFDVAMVFVGSMINRFGDYNTELDNQNLLAGLIAAKGAEQGMALFELLMGLDDPRAPTTIAPGEWSPARRDAATQGGMSPVAWQPYLKDHFGPGETSGRGFSNIIVLGADKTHDARAVLINGPQFGFFQPAYTYSIGLHGAGYDAVGNSPFGYPLIQFGHNRDIGWGSTWGAGDNVDLYRLQLNPTNRQQYWYEGAYRDFERRQERIVVKGQRDELLTVYRSVHGPVVEHFPEQGVAYAKRRAWEGRELATLMAWNKMSQAGNHTQWLAQVGESAINVNWYYADARGNIGYALGGRYPVRVPGHESRVPMPGDGRFDWQGVMPFASNPQVYNPASGYLVNWNNRPAQGFPGPDQWWYAWGEADRVQVLRQRLEQHSRFSPEQAWALMMQAAFEDPNARYVVPRLLALAQRDPTAFAEVGQVLSTWDHHDRDLDADGFYDNPASAIVRTWLAHMLTLTFAPHLPPAQAGWFTDTGYPPAGGASAGSHNISVGSKLLHGALSARERGEVQVFDLFEGRDPEALMRQALLGSLAQLKREQGADMTRWRQAVAVLEFSHKNFLGVPQALAHEEQRLSPAMNLGTQNNMVVFTAQGVQGFEVAAPGQSGFVNGAGRSSPHYDDQSALLRAQHKRAVWLSEQDVERHTVSRERLRF